MDEQDKRAKAVLAYPLRVEENEIAPEIVDSDGFRVCSTVVEEVKELVNRANAYDELIEMVRRIVAWDDSAFCSVPDAEDIADDARDLLNRLEPPQCAEGNTP